MNVPFCRLSAKGSGVDDTWLDDCAPKILNVPFCRLSAKGSGVDDTWLDDCLPGKEEWQLMGLGRESVSHTVEEVERLTFTATDEDSLHNGVSLAVLTTFSGGISSICFVFAVTVGSVYFSISCGSEFGDAYRLLQ